MKHLTLTLLAALTLACSGATEPDPDLCPRLVAATCFNVDTESCELFMAATGQVCYDITVDYMECVADTEPACAEMEATCLLERQAVLDCKAGNRAE